MFKNGYSAVLTVLLVILIIAIIIIVTIFAMKVYKNSQDEKESEKAYAELKDGSGVITEENNEISENLLNNYLANYVPENNNTIGEGTENKPVSRPKTKFYKEYPMVGYIKIPKTNVEYPILLDVSVGALETAVGVMFPSNPKLNQPGNVVIIGHNYRNGQFFSNNKKLDLGDTIQITDLTGKTLTYKIYEIFQTSETDTEYITRERGNNIEISLSTCTDDGKARLVILARVE